MICRTTSRSDLFDQVKARVTIQAALEKYGAKHDRRGRVFCPLHTEDTPSFKVYDNRSFYCFGCGAGGDVITLVAKLFDLTNREAAEKLAADFGVPGGQPMSAGAIRHAQIERAKRERAQAEKDAHARHLTALAAESRKLRAMAPPDASPDDLDAWAEWAASRARLTEIDTIFEEEEINGRLESS